MVEFISLSEIETKEFAKEFAKTLVSGDILCINGDLGVGKTVFVKGICEALDIKEHITSPTFAIMNEYEGRLPVYHFDIYRIYDEDELLEIGFTDFLYGEGVSIIEWAEKLSNLMPKQRIDIEIRKDETYQNEDYRKIIIDINK